ncbi:hypothetical protein ABW19_dt0202375 [Dactylella cylindrospora]|nr:hypothetical protein ABW19_dt0202375 [Dactylella cylindrospora]
MEAISYDKGSMAAGSDRSGQHMNIHKKPASSSTHIETFVGNPQFPIIPLFTPPISAPTDEVVKEPRRFKLSPKQTLALEKLYHSNPKPNQDTKRELATAINLSPTRVNIWFQNRRHRAKVNKRAQEAKMAQILETAGRERLAKMAMAASNNPSEHPVSDIDAPSSTTSPQAGLPLLTTEFSPLPSGTNSPLYSSPKEAAQASLARSLAIATAYAASFVPNEDGTAQEYHPPQGLYEGSPPDHYSLDPYDQNFYPVSAFSDWGSSYYTPTPAGQGDDPFEFDRILSQQYQMGAMPHGVSALPPAFQDDYSAFAEAVHMNSMPKTMNMNLKSRVPIPPALVLKNNGENARPGLTRVATCPDLSNMESMAMQNPQRPGQPCSETSSPVTDATPKMPPPMERSQSYNDRPSLQQEMALRRLRPAPPVNGPNSRTHRIFQGKVSVPQSPLRSGLIAEEHCFVRPQDGHHDRSTPLLTPPSDSDFATAAMKHRLKRKPSDLSKEHSPTADVPDLESDSGFTNADTPIKQNLASPPPTPEVANGLAQAAAEKSHQENEEFTSYTKMLEQSSPIIPTPEFAHDQKSFHSNVESWVNMSHPGHHYHQAYWTPGHSHHPSVDTQIAFEFSNLDIPQQSPLAYGMHDGHHHHHQN